VAAAAAAMQTISCGNGHSAAKNPSSPIKPGTETDDCTNSFLFRVAKLSSGTFIPRRFTFSIRCTLKRHAALVGLRACGTTIRTGRAKRRFLVPPSHQALTYRLTNLGIAFKFALVGRKWSKWSSVNLWRFLSIGRKLKAISLSLSLSISSSSSLCRKAGLPSIHKLILAGLKHTQKQCKRRTEIYEKCNLSTLFGNTFSRNAACFRELAEPQLPMEEEMIRGKGFEKRERGRKRREKS
jgi:hypothetical protein